MLPRIKITDLFAKAWQQVIHGPSSCRAAEHGEGFLSIAPLALTATETDDLWSWLIDSVSPGIESA